MHHFYQHFNWHAIVVALLGILRKGFPIWRR